MYRYTHIFIGVGDNFESESELYGVETDPEHTYMYICWLTHVCIYI